MSGSTSILDSLSAAQPTPGMQAAGNSTSMLDSLPAAQLTPGMQAAQSSAAQAQQGSSWGDLGSQLFGGAKRGTVGLANALIPDNPFTLRQGRQPLFQIPEPTVPQAKDFAGRAAERVGEFIPGMALGAGGGVAGMARQILPSIAGGIGSEAAEEAAPDNWKGAASMAGGLLGGVGPAAAQEIAGQGLSAAGRAAGMMGIGPRQDIGGVRATSTQAEAAGKQVSEALGPEGAERVNDVGQSLQFVPGSQPTTAQVAQTPGAVALEKAHRVATPEPFIARAQDQNNARLASIQGLAPEGQAGAVGDYFRQRLADLDQAGAQATASSQRGVQQATSALGGEQPTEAYGEQARAALQSAREPVHAATRALWDAVDPDGTWALPVAGMRDTAQSLIRETSPTAQTDAQEQGLLQRAAGMPDVAKFQDLGQMRADINAAMRRLSGTPGYDPNIRRLTMLKGSLDQSIADAAEGRAGQEAQAVASGQMQPEQTMMANLKAETEAWRAARDRNAVGGAATGTGGNFGTGPRGYAGGGYSAVSGASGAEVQAPGRSANATGNQGLPGQAQPLEPNFGQEPAQRYQAAVAATRAEKQRFGQGAVGQVLRPGKQGEDYAVQAGNVPGKIFTGGPTEPAEVQRFIAAVGGPQQAADIGRNALANELRQVGIIRPDGSINSGRFQTWLAKRGPTIDQFPGLRDQFANARRAQETLDTATATHGQALKDFERSAAARFVNDDPQVAVGKAFGSGNSQATFQTLVRQVRGNPDAENGLKRAVADYILEKTRGATPSGATEDFLKADTFRKFVRTHSGALKELFGGQGVQNLDMVAADLRRQAQMATATAGSDTAANIAAAKRIGLREGGFHGTALAIIGEQLGELAAHATGHAGVLGQAVGAALGGGGYLVHALRQRGIATTNDLVREAMLNPQLARELMARAPAGQISRAALRRIGAALQGTVIGGAASEQRPVQ